MFFYVVIGQGPLQSPSVFNFFSPSFAPPGEIRDGRLVAPEMQIATEYLNTWVTNLTFAQAFTRNSATPGLEPDDIFINLDEEAGVAADASALVDLVAEKLLAGQISDTLRAEITQMVDRIDAADTVARSAEAVYFVVTSPEYAYQR